jgi:phage gp36-like protein
MYARLADLTARYGEEEINQVADSDGSGAPDPALVRRVLEDASSEINLALGARYRLPIRRPPAILVKIACAIAREALYADAPPKEVLAQAKWARETLKGLAEGVLRFAGLEPAGEAVSNALVEMVSGREQSPFESPVRRRRTED